MLCGGNNDPSDRFPEVTAEVERPAYDSLGMQTGGIRRVDPPQLEHGMWGAGPTPALRGGEPLAPRRPDYAAIQSSREFAELRSRLRRFVFPMTFVFLSWYLTFVLLAAYAHDFMGRQVVGLITVGMLLGLAQFVTTLAITFTYNLYAKRKLDPQVDLVRAQAGVGPA
ncbi:MAG: hypothetical protein QOE84_3092 [Actinomycetota bacterium]|nr:hypothetical protein [Actinomycetota bacterium]